jgi:hypothetical protein
VLPCCLLHHHPQQQLLLLPLPRDYGQQQAEMLAARPRLLLLPEPPGQQPLWQLQQHLGPQLACSAEQQQQQQRVET